MQKLKLQFKIQNALPLLVVAAFALAPAMANAAAFSLTPTTLTPTKGQSVTVTIILNPQESTVYSAKVALRYPADLLEFTGFRFASGWTHASADDFTDTSGGIIRRTAGYPNPGLSSQATLGTVSFSAKASGAGAVSITTDSAVYDGSIQNVLSGVPVGAKLTVSAPPPPPPPPPETAPSPPPSPSTAPPSPEPPPLGESSANQEESIVEGGEEEPAAEKAPFLAQIGAPLTLGTSNVIVGVLLGLAALYAVYALWKRTRRRKNQRSET